MSAKSCPHFDHCDAQLCPLDPESLAHCDWFSDEEICRRADQRGLPMIQAQRRIARLTGGDRQRGSSESLVPR